MIIDDVVWEIINNGHCSYKAKTVTNTFCRNEYNVTGLCNRNSCPLANSRYATVIEEKGVCYLYLKTVERAHTPLDLWEKIKLDKSYNLALAQIDENLLYWPEFLKHKCKQRFTRMRQMLVRKRRLKIKQSEEYEVISRKAEKREKSRGIKAEKSALVERHIEEILLEKLKKGVYDDIYNYPSKMLENYLSKEEIQEKEQEVEYDALSDEDENFLNMAGNFNEDDENDGNEDDENDGNEHKDEEDFTSKNETKSSISKGSSLLTNKRKKLKLEYEHEEENNNKVLKNKNKMK